MADITDPLPMPEPKLKDKTRPPLPCPDKVPEVPMRQSKGPGLAERLWCNRWNLIRHFILTGAAAAITAWTTSRSWTVTGGAFVIGGVAGLVRKGGDDELRAATGADSLSLIASALSGAKKEGAVMGIRTEVEEVRDALASLALAIFEKDDTKSTKILAGIMGIIKEGSDVISIPKGDIPEAAAHALSGAAAIVIASKVVYSDEVVLPPTT